MPKAANKNDATPSLKEQMETLADIVEKLEDPNVSLEDSLNYYEQGMTLVTAAGKVLDAAEQRVAMVTEDGQIQPVDS